MNPSCSYCKEMIDYGIIDGKIVFRELSTRLNFYVNHIVEVMGYDYAVELRKKADEVASRAYEDSKQ